MWTQIGKTTVSASTSTTITVASSSGIAIGNWVVIGALTASCEIRKVSGIAGTTLTLASPVLANSHTSGDVYVQTSPNWDILLFGASPSETATNNTTRINNAVTDCHACGGGIVSIPKGEYQIEKYGSTSGCVDLRGKSYIKFIGEGMGVSTLKLAGSSSATVFMFNCYKTGGGVAATNLEWHDLTLDGYNTEYTDEQTHIICSDGGSNYQVSRVQFQARRDGIKILNFDNLQVNNCRFIGCGRSGITVQRDAKNGTIANNYFEDTNDQDIDFEPTGSDEYSPRQWIITGNTFMREDDNSASLSLTGFSDNQDEDENYIISNNLFMKASVIVQKCRNVVFSDNIIVSGTDNKIPFEALKIIERFVFSNNVVVNNGTQKQAVYLHPHTANTTHNIMICDNTIEHGEIHVADCMDVNISGNKIMQVPMHDDVGTLGIRFQITIDPDTIGVPNWGNLVITNNEIQDIGEAGIKITCANDAYKFDQVHIDGNTIQGESFAYGINIVTPSNSAPREEYWLGALIGSSNSMLGDADTISIDVYGSYMTGQNPYRDEWISNGTPEGRITAPQNSLALDKTFAPDNAYIKNTPSGNTGWTLVSEQNMQKLFEDTFINGNVPPTTDQAITAHVPNINVIGGSWVNQAGSTWVVTPQNEARADTLSSGKALAYFDMLADGQIKVLMSTNGSGTTQGGIVFRYDSSTSFWQLHFANNGTGSPKTLNLTSPSGASTPVSLSQNVDLDASGLFSLKVMLRGDYISVFYNDQLIWAIKNNANNTKSKHGLWSKSASGFAGKSFKFLIV
jgi:hypothetical protein